MDFDLAAKRLARDQSKLKKKRTGVGVSEKAKREAELSRRRAEQVAEEKRAREQRQAYIEQYVHQCERAIKLQSIPQSPFTATSVHGAGDKLTLPPSVLEFITSKSDTVASPWTFRVGIVRPEYQFPASPLLENLKMPNEDEMEENSSSSDEDEDDDRWVAYRDELSHKYLAYTHATVIEFTQEDGHVGLPEPVAHALLRSKAPTTRTVDPAGESHVEMDVDEQTPGHLAWGAFDIPSVPVEVTLVQLPKGKACTLTPTKEAVENGFYNLTDIKLVLEQSLIRTRATLTLGDRVHTWHRGHKFDLDVTAVRPSTFQAVVCINTDIEVDFGRPEGLQVPAPVDQPVGGRTLAETPSIVDQVTTEPAPVTDLIPEPPVDQSDGVCAVQIRGDGAHGKRRFDVNVATMQDLFAFARSIAGGAQNFRLVTRFPRRVFALDSTLETTTLAQAGVQPGQELFMLERV